MGIADGLKLVKAYGTLFAVLGAITFASAWIHNREKLAVARAELRHFTDSVTAKVNADSVASAQRDSAAQARISQLTASKHTAEKAAEVSAAAVKGLEATLADAKTAVDTISAQSAIIIEQKKQILSLSDALARADSINTEHEQTEIGLRHDLSDLRSANASLIARLNQQAKTPLLSSTPVRLVTTILAVKGAVDFARGH